MLLYLCKYFTLDSLCLKSEASFYSTKGGATTFVLISLPLHNDRHISCSSNLEANNTTIGSIMVTYNIALWLAI